MMSTYKRGLCLRVVVFLMLFCALIGALLFSFDHEGDAFAMPSLLLPALSSGSFFVQDVYGAYSTFSNGHSGDNFFSSVWHDSPDPLEYSLDGSAFLPFPAGVGSAINCAGVSLVVRLKPQTVLRTVRFFVGEEVVAEFSGDPALPCSLPESPLPPPGSLFDGWVDGDGNPFPASAIVGVDCDYFARFVPASYTVDFWVEDVCHASFSVSHGSVCPPPSQPQKPSFRFDGWFDENENPFDPDAPVEQNRSFFARFLPLATVTCFDADRSTVLSSTTVACGSLFTPPLPDPPQGFRFDGWVDSQNNPVALPISVESDLQLFAVFRRLSFDLTFDFGDGLSVVRSYAYGDTPVPPEAPEKEGYRFSRYDDLPDVVTASVTVRAVYLPLSVSLLYYDGDTCLLTSAVTYPEVPVLWTPPQKDGFRFLGWYFGDAPYQPEPLLADTALAARYEPIYYDVSVDGTPFRVRHGVTLAELPFVPPEGYRLLSYLQDGKELSLDDPVVEPLTLSPNLEAIPFSVTVAAPDSVKVELSATVAFVGDAVSVATYPPEGYRIATVTVSTASGQNIMLENGSFRMPAENVTLSVELEDLPYLLTVRAEGNPDLIVRYGESFTLKDPKRAGMVFLGWYSDPEHTIPFDGTVRAPYGTLVTVYPAFAEAYVTVSFVIPRFEYDGIEYTAEALPQELPFGSECSPLTFPAPAIEGHTFCGYYFDASLLTPFSDMTLEQSLTLYADYRRNRYRIEFCSDLDLSCRVTTTVPFAEVPEAPLPAEVQGFRFDGWSPALAAATADTVYRAAYTALFRRNYYVDEILIFSDFAPIDAPVPDGAIPAPRLGHLLSEYLLTERTTAEARFDATFLPLSYPIEFSSDHGGTLSLPGDARYGDTVSIGVRINDGYRIDCITVNGVALPQSTKTFTMPAEPVAVRLTTRPEQKEIGQHVETSYGNYSEVLLGEFSLDRLAADVLSGTVRLEISAIRNDPDLLAVLRLTDPRPLSSAKSFTVSFTNTKDGQTGSIPFADGTALPLKIPYVDRAGKQYAAVVRYDETGVTYCTATPVTENGIAYLSIEIDRPGTYVLVNVSDTPRYSDLEIALIASLSGVGLIGSIASVALLFRKRAKNKLF